MSRPRTPDGKRVSLSVKVSEAKAAAVDLRRGVLGRAAYLESLIDADLNGFTGKPEPAARKRAPRRGAPVSAEPASLADALKTSLAGARKRCPHPGTRVIGGWCAPCGVVVGSDGYLP